MWNPFKIAKLSYRLWSNTDDHYETENTSAKNTVELYSQMFFPSNIFTIRNLTSTENGTKLLAGQDQYSREWQEKEYIPLITDTKYMESLAPETVGAHYYNVVSRYSFAELYNGRFDELEDNKNRYTKASKRRQKFVVDKILAKRLPESVLEVAREDTNKIRANFSRHVFLAHDFWHVLFRYNTDPLGEACIQAVTHAFSGHTGPYYLSHLMAIRECIQTRSMKPWGAIRDAHRLAKMVDPEFYLMNFKELLEMNIEEVRTKYGIRLNAKYWKSPRVKRGNDSIHPQYEDTKLFAVSF